MGFHVSLGECTQGLGVRFRDGFTEYGPQF